MGTTDEELTGDWDLALLPANVRLERDVWIERRDSFARMRSERDPAVVIGEGTRVYMWTTFNLEPSGQVVIGRRCVLVSPVFMCAERIEIGDDVVISYGVTIADSDFHPLDPDARRADAAANAPGGDRSSRPRIETRPVRIEDGAWIGIGAMVLKGVTIGRDARVGPGALVIRDVPAGVTVEGNPAQVVG